MHAHTSVQSIKTNIEKIMYEVKIYARDKNGNRGNLIETKKYPTERSAARAKSALIYLCTNQYRFSKEWTLKNVIIV